MSAAHHPANKTHTKGFTQMHKSQQFGGVAIPIILVIAVVVLIAMVVPTGGKKPEVSDGQAVAERIQPVGSVELKASSGGGAPRTGEQVWQAQCAACHAAGALGAPKIGDTAAWGPRIKTGFEALLNSAMKGKNSMPPQSGGASTDYEISRALVYMANKGGANFEEPKPPADAASAAQ
jgi:cytochrome c5